MQIVLWDAENVGGCGSPYDAYAYTEFFRNAEWWEPGQVMLVGLGNPAKASMFANLGWRPLVVEGKNGADRALSNAFKKLRKKLKLTSEDTVVICSGDHWFLRVVESARTSGATVIVVTREGDSSRQLTDTADVVEYLPSKMYPKIRGHVKYKERQRRRRAAVVAMMNYRLHCVTAPATEPPLFSFVR